MKKTALAVLITSFIATNYASAAEESIFDYTSTKGLFKTLDLTSKFNAKQALNLESGSLTFRVKNSTEFGTYFGVADPNTSNNYLAFYSQRNANTKQDTFGVEIKKSTNLISNNDLKVTLDPSDAEYRSITYTFDKDQNQINIYIDGQKIKTVQQSKFFADIPALKNAALGETLRSTRGNYKTWKFAGDIFYANFDAKVLTPEEIATQHEEIAHYHNYQLSKREVLGANKSRAISLFSPNQNGSKNYRIPSLLSTENGVVIAAIDKRNQHGNDWGNIDTAIRRSFDNGKTWQEDQVILDLVSQPYGTLNAAFLIDPSMVQDKRNGRVFMLLDMFPEMQGLFNFPNHGEGTGYKKINGKYYRLLTDDNRQHYTVRENGVVYGEDNQPTNYHVIVEGNRDIAYKDLGDLYEGDTKLGNIFLNTNGANTGRAPLVAKRTSYLWLVHSDDNGETWSNPLDITPHVKEDWMQFLGTGPGTGIQLKNGNLVLPVYYTSEKGGLNSQSAAVIISRDGGLTWERGESPMDRWAYENDGTRELNNGKLTTESQLIELDNGDLKMFSRNRVGGGRVIISTSKDGGYTWQNTYQVDDILLEPYSQLSVIKYSKKIEGKEVVLFANPHAKSRVNGKVWLGLVQEDGSIEWKYNTSITTGNYAYNSLTELPDGRIGLLYEGENGHIKYVSLNLQELMWHDNYIYRDARDSQSPKEVNLDSEFAETFYKIGDGEMIKVGEGINPAHLVIQEGTATLNQTANGQGEKQAYQTALVEAEGKLRLGTADQMPLDKIYLNGGSLDLYGNNLTVSSETQLKANTKGEHSGIILGNIVNDNVTTPATLTYTLDGQKAIAGNLGNSVGQLNLVYEPEHSSSTVQNNLSILGNTILNVVDVKSGVVYYQQGQHQANTVNLSSQSALALGSNTTSVIGTTQFNENSSLLAITEAGGVTQLTTNTTGSGTFAKSGDGLLKLSGDLAHSGRTLFNGGQVEFNGNLTNGTLTVSENTILGGSANITGEATFKAGSMIAPGFNQRNEETFGAQVMKFANVINEGTSVFLRVNNNNSNISTWEHDQLLISGDLVSDTTIPVQVEFLGNEANGQSDSNRNGQYDINEGISLIQVKGKSKVGQFALAPRTAFRTTANSLYPYALVSVEKDVSHVDDNRFGDDNKFYDFRLQTLLVDEKGNSPEPVIRVLEEVGAGVTAEEKPTFSDLKLTQLLLEEKEKELEEKQQELEQETAEKLAAQTSAQQAEENRRIAQQEAANANKAKLAAEEASRLAEQAKEEAIKAVSEANNAKLAAQTEAQKAEADKIAAEKVAQLARAEKDAAVQAKILTDEVKRAAQKEAELANADKVLALQAVERANAEKEAARQVAELANAEKEKAEQRTQQAADQKNEAEKTAIIALAAKEAAEQATNLANAEKVAAQKAAKLANADKTAALKAAQLAEIEKVAAVQAAQQANVEKMAAERNAEEASIAQREAEKVAQQATADKLVAEQVASQALADKTAAEESAKLAELDKVAALLALQQAKDAQEIAEKEAVLAKAEKAVAEKNAQLAEANRVEAEKSAQLAEAARLAAEYNEALALADKTAAEKAEKLAQAQHLVAEKKAELAVAEKVAAEKANILANADKVAAEKALEQALAEKVAAEKEAEQANIAKAAADSNAEKANLDKVAADKLSEQAQADKLKAEEELKRELEAKATEEARKQREAEEAARRYRVAVHQKVPSYLVAQNAMLNQGDTVRRQFMDNIWADDKKGFYVNQQNGNAKYSSNLDFIDYGYGYKSKQSSTLFGGYIPLNDNSELHAAIGFSKQTVKPQAVDGSSETRYKTTSFLVGLHNQWDNVIVNGVLGYHQHKGKVATPGNKDIAHIEGSHIQVTGEVGYEIPVGQLTLTPIVTLNYQQLKSNFKDREQGWNVSSGSYNSFSQQVGANIGWKNDTVRLNAGVFYENGNAQPKAVEINAGGQYATFATGRQGNALLFKVNSKFSITKQLSLGLRLEHRQAVSEAKLKQTQFGGKLEYQF